MKNPHRPTTRRIDWYFDMEADEAVQHLANVFTPVRTDGTFDAREDAAIQTIRLAVKAKKADCTQDQSNQILQETMPRIRNRIALVDSEPTSRNEMFRFQWCYKQRQEAYRPELYCFGMDEERLNICSCKQANMEWPDWADWFSYGHFRKQDVFVLDKARIWHEIHTNLHKFKFCPCLRPKLAEQVIARLPDEVSVSSRSGWKYKESYEQTPTSIKVVEREKKDGYSDTNEFHSDGVQPVGHAVANQILTKAFKACGIVDVNVEELTG